MRELRSLDGGWGRWLSEQVVCREGVIRTEKPGGQHNYDRGSVTRTRFPERHLLRRKWGLLQPRGLVLGSLELQMVLLLLLSRLSLLSHVFRL